MGAIIQVNGAKKVLGTNALKIGKKSDNQLQVSDASDHHAEIRFIKMTYKKSSGEQGPAKQQYSIVDLGSQKGTFVNGQKLRPQKEHFLSNGDDIRIGRTRLTYKKSSSEASGGGVFLLLILVIGIVVALNLGNSTPEKTLSAYCDALKSKDYQVAYDQLADSVQKQETEKQFASRLQQTFNNRGGLKDCVVAPVQANDSSATSILTYTFSIGKTSVVSYTLIKENDTWKIMSKTL